MIIRKVKAGRDPIVRRVKTSNTGDFGASKPKGSRLYWAFAKKTSFPTQAGVRVICLPNRAFVRT